MRIVAEKGLRKAVNGFVSQMSREISDNGAYFSSTGILGCYHPKKNRITYFDSDKSTRTHELAHQRLNAMCPNIDSSFSEGFAYAYEDFLHEDETFSECRRDFSIELAPYHLEIVLKQFDGGLNTKDHERIADLVEQSNLDYLGNNLAAYLDVVENLRFYAVFHDILMDRGADDGERAIMTAARKAQEGMLGNDSLGGIRELVRQSPRSDYRFNELPLWVPRLFGRQGVAVRIQSEDKSIAIELQTQSQNVVSTFSRLFQERQDSFSEGFRGYMRPDAKRAFSVD
jgi:hypothetical protein